MIKRLVSGSLAFCLAALCVLSSPIEARADAQDLLNILAATPSNARPVVTEPDEVALLPAAPEPEIELEDDIEDQEEITELLTAGANSIDDFDPSSLQRLPPEQVELALDPAAQQPVNIDIPDDYGVDTQANLAYTIVGEAIAAILWACGASGLTADYIKRLETTLKTCAESMADQDFTYMSNVNHPVTKTVTMGMMANLLSKLESSKTSDGLSVTLEDNDRTCLGYLLYANGTNVLRPVLDLKPYIHVRKAVGCDYFYYVASDGQFVGSGLPTSTYILSTPNKAALMVYSSGYYFYYRNAATADYGFTLMQVNLACYNISSASGMYETDADLTVLSDYVQSSKAGAARLDYSLPFPTVSKSNLTKAEQYISTKDVLLLECLRGPKACQANTLYSLTGVNFVGDVLDTIKSDKNLFGTISGVNTSAGTVTGVKLSTDTDTDTKPGTDTGTGSGTTTGTTTVDMTGVINELKTIQTMVTTMQTSVGTMSTTMSSVLAELQAIKALLQNVSAGVSTKVDLSPVVGVVEDVQADILDIRDTIEVLRAEVAAQQELITDIKTNVAAVPDLIDDVRAEVAAVPALIDGVCTDVKTLTDTLLDVYPALDTMTGTITDTGTKVGTKVDALPGAITDTMADAITTDMTTAQTSKDWAMSSPLYDRFPFSIPWDVAGCFSLLVAEPIKPIWRIPFKVDTGLLNINEEVVIDLSGDEWSGPVKVVRAFILIAFIAGLAIITRGLIKG